MPWHLEEAYSSWSREKRGWQRKLRVGKAYLWRSKQRITASSTSSPPSVVSAQVLLFQCLSTGCSLAEFLNNDVLQAATAWSWAISRRLVCCPEACRYHTISSSSMETGKGRKPGTHTTTASTLSLKP
jgi:hypothetical protein